MKTKTTTISTAILALALLTICTMVNAQIKYDSKGNLTIGDLTPYKFYSQTILSNGVYLTGPGSNFFQIDVTPAATRLASHFDQVVFYNSQTSTFNSIQVKNVYNYSDARAKNSIQSLSKSLSIIKQLRPVQFHRQLRQYQIQKRRRWERDRITSSRSRKSSTKHSSN